MKTSRRGLLKGLLAAPLMTAVGSKATARPTPDTMKPEWHDFPVGCLIVVAGAFGSGKSLLMNDFLRQVVKQKGRTISWISKRYDSIRQREFVSYRKDVVFLTEGVYNHYQLQELKEFAVRHRCCVVVEYHSRKNEHTWDVQQIHDSIRLEVPGPAMFIPDVLVWMQPRTMITSELRLVYFPLVVKNRLGTPTTNLPFKLHDVMTVPVSEC